MKKLHVRDIHRMQLALQHRRGALPLVFVDQVNQLIDQHLRLRTDLAIEIRDANKFRKKWATSEHQRLSQLLGFMELCNEWGVPRKQAG